jgi:hypothetical protein
MKVYSGNGYVFIVTGENVMAFYYGSELFDMSVPDCVTLGVLCESARWLTSWR